MSAPPASHPQRPTPLAPLLERVEAAAALDRPARALAGKARGLLRPPALKAALSGTWLGHAVHPVLTDVVIGSFLSATLLDLFGGDGDGKAQEHLIAIGMAVYPPTALTGVNDWADAEPTDERVRRTGLVHATTNGTALALFAASLAARRRGARGTGVVLGLGGSTLLSLGGFLGGHLSFAQGVGPDQTAFDRGPSEWTAAADAAQLAEGRPARVVVDDTPVLLLRRAGGVILAVHDRCSHRGCSLTDGEIDGDVVRCACHGSRFDLRDGAVLQGPATAPQPAFEAREREGRVEIRRQA